MTKRKPYKKIINEVYSISTKKGGGLIKIEVWENDLNEVVKYSFAYINPMWFTGDNGRVLGDDNAHNFHHKHYYGKIYPVDN
jgi:hypothetical protein